MPLIIKSEQARTEDKILKLAMYRKSSVFIRESSIVQIICTFFEFLKFRYKLFNVAIWSKNLFSDFTNRNNLFLSFFSFINFCSA